MLQEITQGLQQVPLFCKKAGQGSRDHRRSIRWPHSTPRCGLSQAPAQLEEIRDLPNTHQASN
jgi:hypothetical protein